MLVVSLLTVLVLVADPVLRYARALPSGGRFTAEQMALAYTRQAAGHHCKYMNENGEMCELASNLGNYNPK